MNYKYALYEVKNGIATITLNRPEKLNVLNMMGTNEGVFTDMLNALTEAEDDDSVKVIVIRGAGKHFCAGEDLSQAGFVYGFGTGKKGERRPSERIRLKYDKKFMSDWCRLLYCPKLTIGVGHGYCLGAGTMILNFTDFAIVTDDAELGFIEERIGTVGSANPFVMSLILTVGLKRARDLIFTARRFSGKEAAGMNLVTRSVPADQIDKEVKDLAEDLAMLPRDGIAIGKASLELWMNIMGMHTASISAAYMSHTLFTNLRWEADEYNFFRERREQGLTDSLHGMQDRFKKNPPVYYDKK
ncbi:MAG: enoyl-CoA hydratase/isomerase family protein [Chloroflexi bacterium]|nr:enoyl-CoA hydratase/isomerase family protein [Chloroflexota bacterium]